LEIIKMALNPFKAVCDCDSAIEGANIHENYVS
jgi:hypothetical protein